VVRPSIVVAVHRPLIGLPYFQPRLSDDPIRSVAIVVIALGLAISLGLGPAIPHPRAVILVLGPAVELALGPAIPRHRRRILHRAGATNPLHRRRLPRYLAIAGDPLRSVLILLSCVVPHFIHESPPSTSASSRISRKSQSFLVNGHYPHNQMALLEFQPG